jgi:DNA polymerase III epsilon subunit-like protein
VAVTTDIACPDLAGLRYAVLDLETTGLDPARSRIVEIAVVHVDGKGARGPAWHTLVDPGIPVTGTEIHGVRQADVDGAPTFADIAGTVVDLVAGRVVTAHNADFDLGHLRTELRRVGIATPEMSVLCTMRLTTDLDLDVPDRRLETCLVRIGVENTFAHSALHDAAATACLLGVCLGLARAMPVADLTSWSGPLLPAPRSAWPRLDTTAAPKPRPGVDLTDLEGLPVKPPPGAVRALANEISAPKQSPRCPECRARLVRRQRRRDGKPFLGCLRFPDCGHTREVALT